MKPSLALLVLLILGVTVAQQDDDQDWNNWNPSAPLGPRPTPPTPPILPNDTRVAAYQQQMAQWCSGCITRCLLWRNMDFGQCADNSTCGCPVGLKLIPSPFLPIDETDTCPLGYAPAPQVRQASSVPKNRGPPKNVVIFLLDDLDELVTPYFTAMPFAKSLFKEDGARFANAFSSTSVCCAARCQLLTGMYGHNVGVLANSGKYGGLEAFKMPHDPSGRRLKDYQGRCINNENRILPLMLQQQGYKTAIWGKYINGFENDTTVALNYPVPPGWDEFVIPSSRGYYTGYNYMLTKWNSSQTPNNVSYEYFGIREQDYLTDVIREKSVDWVDNMRQDGNRDPLFMYISPAAPHFPITAARRHLNLTTAFNNLYNTTVPNRRNFNCDVSHKPLTLREHADARKQWTNSPWPRLDFVKRMGSLAAVDELIMAVHSKFQNLGELQNTVFILTSDNGYNNGAFGLSHKMAPYENSVRIPLYFSGGGILPKRTIREQALLIDLAPTIMDFANLDPANHMDGKSWWRNLMLPSSPDRSKRVATLLQYKMPTPGEDPNSLASEAIPAILAVVPPVFALDLPPYRAIRTDRYMLAEWVNGDAAGNYSLEYEAYDMLVDPMQMINVYDTLPEPTLQALMRSLNDLSRCSGQNCWRGNPRNLPI